MQRRERKFGREDHYAGRLPERRRREPCFDIGCRVVRLGQVFAHESQRMWIPVTDRESNNGVEHIAGSWREQKGVLTVIGGQSTWSTCLEIKAWALKCKIQRDRTLTSFQPETSRQPLRFRNTVSTFSERDELER